MSLSRHTQLIYPFLQPMSTNLVTQIRVGFSLASSAAAMRRSRCPPPAAGKRDGKGFGSGRGRPEKKDGERRPAKQKMKNISRERPVIPGQDRFEQVRLCARIQGRCRPIPPRHPRHICPAPPPPRHAHSPTPACSQTTPIPSNEASGASLLEDAAFSARLAAVQERGSELARERAESRQAARTGEIDYDNPPPLGATIQAVTKPDSADGGGVANGNAAKVGSLIAALALAAVLIFTSGGTVPIPGWAMEAAEAADCGRRGT